jgi:hypothetical protein
MAFEMGSVPKDPIDVRHFSLCINYSLFNIDIFYVYFVCQREKKFILIRTSSLRTAV